jgi:serine/threonine-protein kinase
MSLLPAMRNTPFQKVSLLFRMIFATIALRKVAKREAMKDIRHFVTFKKIEPIDKGLSSDRKYYVETDDGQRLMLRISGTEEYERKKAEFEMMGRVYELGVLTSQPVDFGLCDGGKSVYSLSGWLEGENVESALLHMNEAEHYRLGMKAGNLLRKIHALHAPKNAEPWSVRFRRNMNERVEFYNEHDIKSANAELTIAYLQSNTNLLDSRHQTFCHGDFWAGNLILLPYGEIGIIDFNYYNLGYGDPWLELVDAIIWGQDAESYFLTGLLRGYFDGEPPNAFFAILPYYFAHHALSVLCETANGHGGTLEDGNRHMENVLLWFDNFNNPVPTWYLRDYQLISPQ